MTKVKNREGDKYKPRPSWLKYWMDEMDTNKIPDCACCGDKKAVVGGHVYKADPRARKNYYIVPLCKSCNNPYNTDEFLVPEDWLVPATSD